MEFKNPLLVVTDLEKSKDFTARLWEHRWGQRVVRFYDPDLHIIEVGEKMGTVCRRFLDGGMTVKEVAVRMDVPADFVTSCVG